MEEKKEINKEEILTPYEMLNLRRSLSIAVGTFKSIKRAAKRGHIIQFGSSLNIIGRPFNNRANTSTRTSTHSRRTNEQKKLDYENAKRYSTKQSIQ